MDNKVRQKKIWRCESGAEGGTPMKNGGTALVGPNTTSCREVFMQDYPGKSHAVASTPD